MGKCMIFFVRDALKPGKVIFFLFTLGCSVKKNTHVGYEVLLKKELIYA